MSRTTDALEQFGHRRCAKVRRVVNDRPNDRIGTGLILAIGVRESDLRNIVGDGGHGRGFLQIDDRYHDEWLASVQGCRDGEWKRSYESAAPAGRVPPLVPMARYAVHLLHGNLAYAKRNGVPKRKQVPFAVAAYNCGAGGALAGWREDDNPDKYTTGGNYAADVLKMRAEANRWLKRAPR